MRRTARALVGVVVGCLMVGLPGVAHATAGDLGHDVSYPQCGSTLPSTTDAFRLVGVTDGKPWYVNPCLVDQAQWAAGAAERGLYTNTANPGHVSSHWPTSGSGRCHDATVDTDSGCAYEYGRAAAADALAQATSALSGTGVDPKGVTWWLDAEGSRTPGQNGNSWVGSGVVNAADLQGFVDGLRQGGVPEVGIYSTAFQWGDITEGYSRATSSGYRSAWGFAPSYPIEDGPVWFAGVGSLGDAQNACSTGSFTGGERLLAQYADAGSGLDGDHRCADPDHGLPTVAVGAPTHLVTRTSTVAASWTGADTGTGVASYDLRTERAPYNGAFRAWQYPAALQRTATRSASVSTTGQGWTTCIAVRSRDVAGNLSAWSAIRCTAVPLDDRALSASAGWSRATGRGYFASTYTTTTRYGATLVRTGVVSTRLHLLALRCSTCGKVGVYVGSTLLATVNLAATSTSVATIPLPRFSLRSATVTIKVLTSGRTVRVDGLATSRV